MPMIRGLVCAGGDRREILHAPYPAKGNAECRAV
jgi:hypothetical protein